MSLRGILSKTRRFSLLSFETPAGPKTHGGLSDPQMSQSPILRGRKCPRGSKQAAPVLRATVSGQRHQTQIDTQQTLFVPSERCRRVWGCAVLLARVRNLDATHRLRGRTSWICEARTRLCMSRFPLCRWRLLRPLLMPDFPRLPSYSCHDFYVSKDAQRHTNTQKARLTGRKTHVQTAYPTRWTPRTLKHLRPTSCASRHSTTRTTVPRTRASHLAA